MALMKLVVLDKNVIISSVHRETASNYSSLLKSLEDFQHDVNATLSKLISDQKDSAKNLSELSEDDDEDEHEDMDHPSAKKKK